MIGILFATEMEARPFLERGEPEGTVTVICGMGMAAAREATGRLIRDHGCTAVINAGVCGALNRRLKRGAVYRVSMVCTEHLKTAVKVGVGFGLKRLVTVEEPVFQPARRYELSKEGDLVDMEGYAVARVCEEHDIPCILIKGVTDFGDPDGRNDIQRHIDSVSASVAEAVLKVTAGASRPVEDRETGRPAGKEQDRSPALMKRLHSFTKIEHTIFSLPLLFAGAWLGAGAAAAGGNSAAGSMPSLRTLLLIALVGLGARTFGMAVNRIMDRKLDAENPRTRERELPSGKLSLMQGYAVALAGIGAYFIGCALLGETVLRFSLVPLIPLSLYSLLKRFTPLCHYGIGLCLAAAPLGAFVAAADSVAFTPEVILLALFAFFWISGFDIIYAILDIDFDRAHHVRSIPAAVGGTVAQWIAALTHLVSFSALVLLWMSVGGTLSFIALLTAAAAFGAAYLPGLPLHVRFFPVSAVAGVAGALVVLLG